MKVTSIEFRLGQLCSPDETAQCKGRFLADELRAALQTFKSLDLRIFAPAARQT